MYIRVRTWDGCYLTTARTDVRNVSCGTKKQVTFFITTIQTEHKQARTLAPVYGYMEVNLEMRLRAHIVLSWFAGPRGVSSGWLHGTRN